MTFDLQHIGHAGFMFTHHSVRLLIDPWFFPALFEAWAPYPDNSHLIYDAVYHPNWVYVSHHHQDHFDKRFLDGLERDMKIICPKFRSRRMARLWKGLGFTKIYELGHGDSLKLDSKTTVTMLLDRGYREDSALLVTTDQGSFLDVNDCELASSDIPHADVLAGQYSAASWYPHCYEQPQEVYEEKAAEIRNLVFKRLKDKLKISGATTFIPSAGPPCFPDPVLEQYNPDQPRGKIYWEWNHAAALELLDLGVGVGSCLPYPDDPAAYRKKLWQEEPMWRAFYDRDARPVDTGEIDEHFYQLNRKNSRLFKNYRKLVAVGADNEWVVNLGLLKKQLEETPEPSYWIKTPPQVLRAVLNGEESWEVALTSNRCLLTRRPDTYDSTLMEFLTCGDEPAITRHIAEVRDKPVETVEIGGFTIPRFCPHAGEDLSEQLLAFGPTRTTITCPRHNWCWDVESGECLSGGNVPLFKGESQ